MTEDYNSSPNINNSQEQPFEAQHAKKRQRAIRVTYLVSAVMLIVATIDSILQFSDFRAWQILGDTAFVFSALVVLSFSFRSHLNKQIDRAVNLIPLVIFLAYAPGELFLEGVTFYNLLTGLLLFGLAALIFRPKNQDRWIIAGVVFVGFELIFYLVPLFPKFDISQSPSWVDSLPMLSGVLAVLFVWQLLTTVRLRTIQSRMLVNLIALVMIPALVIGGLSALLGFQSSIDQIGKSLGSSSRLKAEQVNSWLEQATSDLNSLQGKSRFPYNVNLLLFSLQDDYYRQTVLEDIVDVMENSGNFIRMYIIGLDGTVRLSTDQDFMEISMTDSDLFVNGLNDEYIAPAAIDPNTNQLSVQISRPVILSSGNIIGVLVGDLSIPKLLDITADRSSLGETGETYLIDSESILLTPLRYSESMLPGSTEIDYLEEEMVFTDLETSVEQYPSYNGQEVIGSYTWLPDLEAAMILEQDQSEAFESINTAITVDVIVSIITLVAAISFATVIARNLSNPIKELSETASLVSRGELEAIQPIQREDEIGELSQSLSEMTAQMVQTSLNLEKTVNERTAALERRATYLEATAEIGRAITNIRNLEDLLTAVSHLISDKFGFYHVGIFIIDQKKEFAELKAANSEGGWRMLAREHKLRVGEQGIVGFVTGTGRPRIQQQVVGEDSVHYDNPDLPLTKSEMALPLAISGEILGALDVQSVEEQAFSDEDINVLQVLADEVAVAINNTNLFQQLQDSLEAERRVFGQVTQDAWSSMLTNQERSLGYKADKTGIQLISDVRLPESQEALSHGKTVEGNPDTQTQSYPLSVPIKVRGGLTVAILETQKPIADGPWTKEEITILESVGEQLGVALENARLFEETQRSAQRERIAADLSSKIWASTDVDTILQTAVKELSSALSASEGSISLTLGEELQGPDNSHDGAGEE
jgi:GAF domain-containing protein/HAMP domain-containing protein